MIETEPANPSPNKGTTHMTNLIQTFVADENGAAGVEYGLLVALIAAVIVGTVQTLGTQVKAGFTTITAALPAA